MAHDLRMDAWGIDVMIGGSQKGVMLPPGLAFVGISEKAWKFSEKSKCPRFYFNFKKSVKISQRTRQTLHLRLL